MTLPVVNEALAAVENQLTAVINSDVTLLKEAGRHIVESGGKRIRPQLAVLAYLAAGGHDWLRIVPLAAAIELVHTATLVHDDINDHSLTRRGRPTVHARWGRTFALLTGDYLFTKVYELMAPYGAPYNEIMADACVKLVEGETLQAAAAKAGHMDRDTYNTIITRKTASLFVAAVRMGALLADADEPIVATLANFALDLGRAFQITDDVLDLTGDTAALGKPIGADLAQGVGVVAAVGEFVPNGTTTLAADPLQQLMARIRDSGALDLARLQATELAGRARRQLESLPPTPARDELSALVSLVIERQG